MSSWARIRDAVLTSKWNKPFPVTLLPAGVGVIAAVYFAEKQSERQQQILAEIRAASSGNGGGSKADGTG